MTSDEIKKKILAFLAAAPDDDIAIDFDSLSITRVDDGVFKVSMMVSLDEDEEEEEDDDFNEEEVEADESDFDDE